MQRILVLHRASCGRKTVDDHLYSFKRYVEGVEFFYCYIFLRIPLFLRLIDWDGIIIHYSLLAERFDDTYWKYLFKELVKLNKLKGVKVAIPQDEFLCPSDLWQFLKEAGIETVFTCAMPIDYDKLYPLDKTGLKERITTFTGFVDEDSLDTVRRLSHEVAKRDIDIGYRARNLPYWLGKHGQIKQQIAAKVLEAPNNQQLALDISTRAQDVFYGDDWLRFLLRCRLVLGCLGGSSIYDPSGEIRRSVNAYVEKHPDAGFEEVESVCFPGKDYTLSLFALSPRHFECAMTKTCQILLEGDYQGVFHPGRHYIELKSDYSNLDEVLEKAADKLLCEQIAENAYVDIVESGKYTYKIFANQVVDHIRLAQKQPVASKTIRVGIVRALLNLHTRFREARRFGFRAWYRLVIAKKWL